MKVKKLKRSLLCFAMVFCIIFSLCGCKKSNAEAEKTEAETTSQTTRETTSQTTKETSAQETTQTTTETTTPTTSETTEETTTETAQTTAETTTYQTTSQTTAKTTQTAKTTTQPTTKKTTQTTPKTTEEEEDMSEEMPDIVFIMSLYINTRRNIFGYFVTNTGEVKMFDFEPIAPGEFYDIQDVYDRLEEAVCDEFPKDMWKETTFLRDDPITDDELDPIPEDELKKKYQDLLSIDKSEELWVSENYVIGEGCYNAYGVRYDQNNEEEILLLYGMGRNIYRRDEISDGLYCWLKWDVFPGAPFPT